jgi:hypothetical protein
MAVGPEVQRIVPGSCHPALPCFVDYAVFQTNSAATARAGWPL